jgi:hypothetical protein
MKNFNCINKPITWQMTILLTAILAGCGGGSSSPAATAPASGALGTASALGSTVIAPSIAVSSQTAVKATAYSIDPTTPSITVSGTYPKLVAPILTGKGFINVVNYANAHVAATQTGTGTLSIVNVGGVLTGSGGVLAATNTGTGLMTVNNGATACAVAVTNVGNGNVTVTAANTDCPAGNKTFALTYTDGLNHIYPAANTALGSSLGASTNNPNIHVTGANAGNVISVLTDPTNVGTITVNNAGAHVAANQTGAGAIDVISNTVGVLAATNTGTGTMTITNSDTGAVAVTRTGNGNTTVTVSGTTPLALSFHGDGDVTYPSQATLAITAPAGTLATVGANLGSSLGSSSANITVSGTDAGDVAPALSGGGSINVVNNGTGHIAATQKGTGAININSYSVPPAASAGPVNATNTGDGVMTITNTDTNAVTVTNTYNGVGSPTNNVTVKASGTGAISCAFTDGLNHNVTFAVTTDTTVCKNGFPDNLVAAAGLGSSLGVSAIPGVTVSGSNSGAVTTIINDPSVPSVATIAVTNNGSGFDTATENGAGSINLTNTGAGVTATNNGNGAMMITSTDTAEVTVTNTGNGKVTVTAGGSDPITLTHVGDDDFVYPVAGAGAGAGTTLGGSLGNSVGNCPAGNTTLFGSNVGAITSTLTQSSSGCGFINATDNGSGAVTATETGAGTVNVVDNGAGVTATNTGDGVMTVTSTDSAQVTVSNTGNGNITVTATGSAPLTLTYTDGLDHTYP